MPKPSCSSKPAVVDVNMTKKYASPPFPSGSHLINAVQKLNDFLEHLMGSEESLIQTGLLSQSKDQFVSLWGLREGIPEAVSKEGKAYKYDLSIPVSEFKNIVEKVRERVKEKELYKVKGGVKEVIGYGHIGDGEWY